MSRGDAESESDLCEELLLRLTASPTGDVEGLLDAHPERREALREVRDAHAALLPRLKAWARAGDVLAAAPGVKIPGYEVLGVLGQGSMGRVFEAVETLSRRRVAIKVCEAVADARLTERFFREVEVLRRIHSPGIVKILDWGSTESLLYYVMDRLEGRNLAELIQSWRDDAPPAGQRIHRACEMVVAACAALDEVHGEGVVHRDVKPSNIFLDTAGAVIVIDFGLAKDLASLTLTESGERLGTFAYMSPEQIRGDAKRIDRRSDVFGLGATLYQTLTLSLPFEREGRLRRTPRPPILLADPIPAHHVDGSVPVELSAIVQKAMEFRPAHRYPTAGDMARDLRAFLTRGQVSAALVGRWGRLRRRIGRRRKPIIAGLVILLAVCAGIFTTSAWSARSVRERAVASALMEARRALDAANEDRAEAKSEQTLLEAAARSHSVLDGFEAQLPYFHARSRLQELESRAHEHTVTAVVCLQRGLEIDRTNEEVLDLLQKVLWSQYTEAERAGDSKELRRLEAQIASYAPGLSPRLDPRAWLVVESDPPGASVYLFRYAEVDLLSQPIPYHPARGELLDHEQLPEPKLLVVRPPGPVLEAWGIALGDRIVKHEGHAIDRTGNRILSYPPLVAGPDEKAVVIERNGKRLQLPSHFEIKAMSREDALNTCTELDAFPLTFLDGASIGTTPIPEVELDAGSYLVVLRLPGYRDTRAPVLLRRDERRRLQVKLFRPEEVPDDFVHVPAGVSQVGGDPAGFYPEPRSDVKLPDYFICRHEAQMLDYFEFLNALRARGELISNEQIEQAEGSGLLPVDIDEGKHRRKYFVTADDKLAPEGQLTLAWSVRWISRGAVERYVAWLNSREDKTRGRWVFALPSAAELEKAGRGADGRLFPWGNSFEWSLCCTQNSTRHQSERCYPFPTDASPYDVRDLAGSVAEMSRTDEIPPGADLVRHERKDNDYRVKGGSGFDDIEPYFHLGGHNRERMRTRSYRIGFRLVAYPRGSSPPE